MKAGKDKQKLLFICSRNQWRSPTAEAIFKNLPACHVRSAGTSESARVVISAKSIAWADIIFVMEKKHKQRMLVKFPDEMAGKQVVVLDIEDNYGFMDPELVEMITMAVGPYLS